MHEQPLPTKRRFLRRVPRGCRITGCVILAVPCGIVGLFLLFISLISPPDTPTTPSLSPDFLKGITYESWWKDQFASANSDETLSKIVQPMGADWIALIVKCRQETLTSTEINCKADTTATDDELIHVIDYAHKLGIKVMLKPHIDLGNLSDSRDKINFGGDESAWKTWFASYTTFIKHYAKLAQDNSVDYLVVGTELWGTSSRADDWRAVIHAVRAVYDGPLTYAALTYFEPWQISWWDALDSIGIDAYYLLTLTTQPTVAQMKLGLQPNVFILDQLAAKWQKPIIFTEIGYLSVDGANRFPGYWQLDGATDPQEQADAYRAIFEVFSGKSWWKGAFWWSLDTNPEQGGLEDRGYSPHGKPAEDILRAWYFIPSDS
jgi:glycosyl hydrolase family 113